MEVTALLKSFIFLTASSLLLPVLAMLAALTVWVVVHGGSFFALWLERRRAGRPADAVEALARGEYRSFGPAVETFCRRLAEVDRGGRADVAVMSLLRETEHRLWKELDVLRIVTRAGPGLGLVGTLIPMGTALASLGDGDLTRLSGELVVAFTTTVVGMTLGLLSHFFHTVQRRWVEEDVRHMEIAAELATSGEDGR
ncbi:MAG TPA: biopolymer transporter [Deltaproteobacteria bacterium]|nr:biopolymer transporter [Deltaproteobacteria bacterium]